MSSSMARTRTEVGIAFQPWPKSLSLVSMPSRRTPQCIPDSIMSYDYDFFTQHPLRIRFYKNNEAPSVIGGPLVDLYQTEAEALKHDQVLARPTDLFDFETPILMPHRITPPSSSSSLSALSRMALN